MSSRPLPDTNTERWYRQFWPWFLIALPASAVIAGLVTVYIAIRGADDLVADDYYREGLTINRRLEKEQRAAELELSPRLQFSGDNVRVMVDAPGDPQELLLHLSHPLDAERDFSTRLSRIAPGSYIGRLSVPVSPRWHWHLLPARDVQWRLDGVIQPGNMANGRQH